MTARAALALTALLAAGCGADTGTGPTPLPPAIVAPTASQEPEPPVSQTATDGLTRSPVNLWGAKGYKWPDGTYTPWIPTVSPWK